MQLKLDEAKAATEVEARMAALHQDAQQQQQLGRSASASALQLEVLSQQAAADAQAAPAVSTAQTLLELCSSESLVRVQPVACVVAAASDICRS